MEKIDIEIKLVDNWPEDEIVKLYKAGNWWKDSYESSGIGKLISGSFAFAVVINKNSGETIGMGRVLSDGVSDAYIQDLVILPEYPRKFEFAKRRSNSGIIVLNNGCWLMIRIIPDPYRG